LIEALRASPCLSSNCAVAPCRAPPPHLLAASIAPHTARRLNRAEASHQPSLGRALALHPRSISLPHRFSAATVRALAHSPARPSIRPFVRPSIHPLPFILSLSLLSFAFSVISLARPCFVSLSLSACSDHEQHSLGYSDARLPLSASSSRHSARVQQDDALCAMRCAPHCLCAFVRSALCAWPCPARRARGAAHRSVRWMTPCTSRRPFVMTVTGQRHSSLDPDKFSWPAAPTATKTIALARPTSTEGANVIWII